MNRIATNPSKGRRYTYGETWGAEEENEKDKGGRREIEITGALVFWTILIVIGVLLNIIAPMLEGLGTNYAGTLDSISHYMLYIPGPMIIALIVAVYIGGKVGGAVEKAKDALGLGLLNAVYASFIYAIIIAILYLIIKYSDPNILPGLTLNNFLVYMVGLPIAIVIIVVPLLASLAAARHGGE